MFLSAISDLILNVSFLGFPSQSQVIFLEQHIIPAFFFLFFNIQRYDAGR